MKVSGQFQPPADFPWGKNRRYAFGRGLGRPWIRSVGFRDVNKHILSHPKIEPRIDPPVSWSQCWPLSRLTVLFQYCIKKVFHPVMRALWQKLLFPTLSLWKTNGSTFYPKLPDCRKSFVFRKLLMSRPLVLPVRAASRKWCAWSIGGINTDSEWHLSHCHFVHYKSRMDWPGIEPGPPRWEAGE